MSDIYQELRAAIVKIETDKLEALKEEVLKTPNINVDKLVENIRFGLEEVGLKFEAGDYYLAELILIGTEISEAVEKWKPLFEKEELKAEVKKAVIGTVEGDIHDIGKNIVGMMLASSGFKIIDLGNDVTADKFVEAVKENTPVIVGMSALLSTTRDNIKKTIDALKENGLRDKVKIIIGGAAVDDDFAKDVDADGYAANAAESIRLVEGLLGGL
ncbi:MAG: cobalamin B12-binding domain-containing protein [Candidatus Jordarchaeum sp.]|uniref:cobalamin B12-binding domain-containing protein n=1 Tax=Candidatus Jordarchaeum sp. TaxID=2823881 RepID=UPI004049886D